jgi:hypothetical protein
MEIKPTILAEGVVGPRSCAAAKKKELGNPSLNFFAFHAFQNPAHKFIFF